MNDRIPPQADDRKVDSAAGGSKSNGQMRNRSAKSSRKAKGRPKRSRNSNGRFKATGKRRQAKLVGKVGEIGKRAQIEWVPVADFKAQRSEATGGRMLPWPGRVEFFPAKFIMDFERSTPERPVLRFPITTIIRLLWLASHRNPTPSREWCRKMGRGRAETTTEDDRRLREAGLMDATGRVVLPRAKPGELMVAVAPAEIDTKRIAGVVIRADVLVTRWVVQVWNQMGWSFKAEQLENFLASSGPRVDKDGNVIKTSLGARRDAESKLIRSDRGRRISHDLDALGFVCRNHQSGHLVAYPYAPKSGVNFVLPGRRVVVFGNEGGRVSETGGCRFWKQNISCQNIVDFIDKNGSGGGFERAYVTFLLAPNVYASRYAPTGGGTTCKPLDPIAQAEADHGDVPVGGVGTDPLRWADTPEATAKHTPLEQAAWKLARHLASDFRKGGGRIVIDADQQKDGAWAGKFLEHLPSITIHHLRQLRHVVGATKVEAHRWGAAVRIPGPYEFVPVAERALARIAAAGGVPQGIVFEELIEAVDQDGGVAPSRPIASASQIDLPGHRRDAGDVERSSNGEASPPPSPGDYGDVEALVPPLADDWHDNVVDVRLPNNEPTADDLAEIESQTHRIVRQMPPPRKALDHSSPDGSLAIADPDPADPPRVDRAWPVNGRPARSIGEGLLLMLIDEQDAR